MAKLSLLGGKHTFVEKPIARTTAQCEWLMDKAVNESVLLMVGHTFALAGCQQLGDGGKIILLIEIEQNLAVVKILDDDGFGVVISPDRL